MDNKDPLVDIKVLRPVGVVLFLLLGVLTVIVCLTADMGVPEIYESAHDAEYYLQSEEHLQELIGELEENVFPEFDGEISAWVQDGQIRLRTDEDIFAKVKLVLRRDFDERLFYFENDEVEEE